MVLVKADTEDYNGQYSLEFRHWTPGLRLSTICLLLYVSSLALLNPRPDV